MLYQILARNIYIFILLIQLISFTPLQDLTNIFHFNKNEKWKVVCLSYIFHNSANLN